MVRRKSFTHVALNLVFTPVLPSSIPRYDQTVAHFGVGKQVIPANLRLGDPSSGRHGDGWTYLVTPEGDGYFYHAQFRIITYNDIRNASIERRLLEANRSLTELASLKDIQIAHCEAFIDVTVETSLTYQAKYYFVDHGSRHPFWVHETRADDLGLPTFESLDDLKNALLPEFWNHIEYFPTHQIIDETYEYELVAILRHGDTDNMTSPGSTFPFSAEECRYHVQTLEGFIAAGRLPSPDYGQQSHESDISIVMDFEDLVLIGLKD
ncbi:hypothetical protein FRB90_005530 [Tulasnella sp. 427]|nr:hypothetical protein FRB90_005530 [Tulasnella sp. 427]